MNGQGLLWRPGPRRRWLDAALLGGVVVLGWVMLVVAKENPDVDSAPFTWPMATMSALAAVPLWWRRERPIGMFVAAMGITVLAAGIDERGVAALLVVVEAAVLCFAIGAWSEKRRWAVAVLGATSALIVLGAVDEGTNILAAAAYAGAGLLLPAAVGYATRTRRLYLEEVEQRLAEAERDRDARARQAVLEERNRIARELHDVVAHHVSLIGVQAGAARSSLDLSPETARAALEAIDASSRAAVGEMRQLLDALAPLPGAAVPPGPLAPQPSLADLSTVVDRWRAAGLAVDLDVRGDVTALAPTVSLCAFRVVEEAVTNAARHSPHRTVAAHVTVGDREVTVDVLDPAPGRGVGGPGSTPVAPPDLGANGNGTGRGLVGMRERVTLARGQLHAAPYEAGFRVYATIPRLPA